MDAYTVFQHLFKCSSLNFVVTMFAFNGLTVYVIATEYYLTSSNGLAISASEDQGSFIHLLF